MLSAIRDFVISHIVPLVGGLGIIGLLLLCILVPAVLPMLLALLRQKATWIIAGLIAAAVSGWELRASFDDGVAARNELAAVQARAAEIERQANAAQQIAADANAREQAAMDESEQRQKKVEAYEAELATRKNFDDVLNADDLGRLRGIERDANPAPRLPPKRPGSIR